jgi:hypothetical protein
LNFRQDAEVTIISNGTARLGEGHAWVGPSGVGHKTNGNYISPEDWGMARLVKTGSIYTPVRGGLLNWSVPTDDNIAFVVNDEPGKYGYNRGGFDVTMEYDDEDLIGR